MNCVLFFLLTIRSIYEVTIHVTATENSIRKAGFTQQLQLQLGLIEVQSPLLSELGSGVQDDLSGWEKAVAVKVKAVPDKDYEVVHSLAKWKRFTLGRYGFGAGEGIVTQMKALRPDEEALSSVHSVYVDQWDWEKSLLKSSVRWRF